jgi:hypothetical protein
MLAKGAEYAKDKPAKAPKLNKSVSQTELGNQVQKK